MNKKPLWGKKKLQSGRLLVLLQRHRRLQTQVQSQVQSQAQSQGKVKQPQRHRRFQTQVQSQAKVKRNSQLMLLLQGGGLP
jgi:hypothetical protein